MVTILTETSLTAPPLMAVERARPARRDIARGPFAPTRRSANHMRIS
jgi:hypothetical protein